MLKMCKAHLTELVKSREICVSAFLDGRYVRADLFCPMRPCFAVGTFACAQSLRSITIEICDRRSFLRQEF
jgi:hypothetical protein